LRQRADNRLPTINRSNGCYGSAFDERANCCDKLLL
jgi:hypothetical protein